MSIKSLVSSAWQEITTLKTLVSSAWQEADHANALVNNAWQEVWSAGFYFVKAGVLKNGAQLGSSDATLVDGAIKIFSTNEDDNGITVVAVKFTITDDMVGKRLYVKMNYQSYLHGVELKRNKSSSLTTYSALTRDSSVSSSSGMMQYYFDIPEGYYDASKQNHIQLLTYGFTTHYIYDIWVE